jgi:hypothetical protein
MNDEYWIGKDMEGSYPDLIHVLSKRGGVAKIMKILQKVSRYPGSDSNPRPH